MMFSNSLRLISGLMLAFAALVFALLIGLSCKSFKSLSKSSILLFSQTVIPVEEESSYNRVNKETAAKCNRNQEENRVQIVRSQEYS